MRSVLLLCLSVLIVGCGASTPKVKQAPTAPVEVNAVVFLLEFSTSQAGQDMKNAQDLLREALRSSGYRLVKKSEDPYDAKIVVHITINEYTSAVQWRRGSKVLGGYQLRAMLSVEHGTKVIHSVDTEFRFTQGEIVSEANNLEALVRQLNAAPSMRELAMLVAEEHANTARQEKQRAAEETEAKYDAWMTECLEPCSSPRNASACDNLSEWLEANADDESVKDMWKEGARVLEESRGAIERLRDERTWFDSRVSECLEYATEDACAGVKSYMRQSPRGSHREDAESALKNLEAQALKRAAQREAEERQQEVEERQREAAARAASAKAAAETSRAQKEAERKRAHVQCLRGCANQCGGIMEQEAFSRCTRSCQSQCQ